MVLLATNGFAQKATLKTTKNGKKRISNDALSPHESPIVPTITGPSAPPNDAVYMTPERISWCFGTELIARDNMIGHMTDSKAPTKGNEILEAVVPPCNANARDITDSTANTASTFLLSKTLSNNIPPKQPPVSSNQ